MIEYNLEGKVGLRTLAPITVDNVRGYSYSMLSGDYLWATPGLTLTVYAPEGSCKLVTRRWWHKYWLRKAIIHDRV